MTYQISKVLSSLMAMRDRTSGDDAQACYDMMVYHLPPRTKAVYRHVSALPGRNAREIAASLDMTQDHASGQLGYLYRLGLVMRSKADGVYVYYAVTSWWQS